MINIETVSKSFSSKTALAVDHLKLDLRDGEILGLVGLNGAGKTTTIRMCSGIIIPTSGKITVDGFDIVSEKIKAEEGVGWIPEQPNFEMNAKPLQLMRYYAGFYRFGDINVERRINELLENVGLSEHVDKKLRNFSQGMKKRFAIAESIIGDPQNILFDETLNGLDPEGVLFVRKLILGMKKEGKAILLSSHILNEIEDLADRVAIVDHGKLIRVLSRFEMKSLGNTVLHIVVDNYSIECEKLLEKYGDVEVSGNELTVRNLTISDERIVDISEELMKSGFRLRKFNPMGESLEEFFFKLIGDDR
jgi:ABC-2 type transport system ATP-binding protein